MRDDVLKHIRWWPWVSPMLRTYYVRMMVNGQDVTPDPPHALNEANCAMVNAQNAEHARRNPQLGPAPVYKYLRDSATFVMITPDGEPRLTTS